MNNSLHRLLVNTAGVIFVIMASVISYPAHAQVNPEIANCEEVRDEATLTQMEFCSGHIGCNMVLKLQKACTKVKGFLSKLKDTLSGRREITNNDVFEASSPTLTSSEALKTKVSVVQKIVRDASNDPNKEKSSEKSSGGTQVYYEGGIKDGHYHGIGVYINESGGMGRGQMNNGRIQGQAQTVGDNGAMFVGDFVNSRPNGNIAYQDRNGTVLAGVLEGKNFSGLTEITLRNGDHYKELNDNEGKTLARGPVAKAGQVAITPTAPGSTAALPSQQDSSTPGSPGYQPRRPSAANAAVVESAAERITKNYDQRITAARGQCTASKESCDSGCTGVAVVGLLTMFASKGAGADEASAQIQQCSNRCDGAKSSCDQQVSSLEQEKSQAIADARNPQQSTASSNVSSANSKYAWDCNLMNGKWKMTASAYPGASVIFSSKVSNGRYTHTRLEVTGIDGSNSVMTGSCSDYTREHKLSKDAMTITLGDGTWVHTRLSSLNPSPNQRDGDGPPGNSASQEGSPEKGNGRARGDRPLFSSRDISSEELRRFNDAWYQKEQEFHDLGEKMPPWDHSLLKTSELRAAYFRLCDERIAAARSRKKR